MADIMIKCLIRDNCFQPITPARNSIIRTFGIFCLRDIPCTAVGQTTGAHGTDNIICNFAKYKDL